VDEDAYDELNAKKQQLKRQEMSKWKSDEDSQASVNNKSQATDALGEELDTVSMLSPDSHHSKQLTLGASSPSNNNNNNNNLNKFNHKPKPKPNIPLSPNKIKTKHGHLDLTIINESLCDENGESIFSATPVPSKTCTELKIAAEPVFPVMKINNAVYGHMTDQKKQIDVTSNIETLVERQVRDMFLGCCLFLHSLF
jgi:hypothetical protein